jgi:hypothetical protein
MEHGGAYHPIFPNRCRDGGHAFYRHISGVTVADMYVPKAMFAGPTPLRLQTVERV